MGPTERVQGVLLTSLAAALLVITMRVVSPVTWSSPGWRGAPALEIPRPAQRQLPAASRATGMPQEGADADEERDLPPDDDRPRRIAGGSDPARLDLIAGVERRRDVLDAARGTAGAGAGWAAAPAATGADDPPSGRIAAVPPARDGAADSDAPPADNDGRFVFDFVDPPAGEEELPPEVLLRLPFDGDLVPEIGGVSIIAEGLISEGDQVRFPEDARLRFQRGDVVNSDSGTISFEIRPEWAGADATNNALFVIREEHAWENTLSIVKNYGALRYIVIDSAGVEWNVNVSIDDWLPGGARRITATWDKGRIALYVDGLLMGENTLANPLVFRDTTPVHVGSEFPSSDYVGASATIRDLTIYARALDVDEVVR